MNITAYGRQRLFDFNLFGTVKEAQMNSGETSVMYESSIFFWGVDIYLLILVVRMTIHINRSFYSLDLTDSFGKEIKTITTAVSQSKKDYQAVLFTLMRNQLFQLPLTSNVLDSGILHVPINWIPPTLQVTDYLFQSYKRSQN